MKSKHVSGSSTATITGWRETTGQPHGWDLPSEAKKICPSRGFLCLFCQVRSSLSLRAQSSMQIAFPHQCGAWGGEGTLIHFCSSDRDGFQSGCQEPHGRGVLSPSQVAPPQAAPSSRLLARMLTQGLLSYVLALPYKSWMSLLLKCQVSLINKYHKALNSYPTAISTGKFIYTRD